jgi:hypothetical protein
MAEIKPTITPKIHPNTTNLQHEPSGLARPVEGRTEESVKQAPKHGVQQMRTGYGIVPPRAGGDVIGPDGTRTQLIGKQKDYVPDITPKAIDDLDTTLRSLKGSKSPLEDKAVYAERMMKRWGVYFMNLEQGKDNYDE